MENERYLQLQSMISRFPHLHQFLDNDFIKEQCKSGLKCYMIRGLAGLVKGLTIDKFKQDLPDLEGGLAGLSPVNGYDRLGPRLQSASDFDGYNAILAQINVTLWFKEKSLLKEIEPKLPPLHREGYADILLYFSQQDIFCEVTSFQSIIKSLESKTGKEDGKIQSRLQKRRRGQPWLTEQDVKNELEIKRAVKNLMDKTNGQLPSNHPGILAVDTSKRGLWRQDMKVVARKLFQKRHQVALIMLWSFEWGSQIGTPPFWFVNPNSPYQNIGQELLRYLGQDNKALDCKD